MGSRTLALVLGVLLALGAGSCGRRTEVKPERPKPPPVTVDRSNPERTVFEQLRAGTFQISGVEGTIEEVLNKVRSLDPAGDKELAAALGELGDALDAVGATLADHSTEPTGVAKDNAEFAKMDERRLAAIAAANDALHELEDAGGILDTLSQDPLLVNRAEVVEAVQLIQLATHDLREAIGSLGGTVEQAPAS